MRLPSLVLASVLLLAGCSSVPQRPTSIARGDYAATREYVTRLIRHEMDKNDVAGLSIALVDDQRIVWAEGFGYADRERHVPATAETLYRVGSISKLFTDTAAMQLSEQGRWISTSRCTTTCPDSRCGCPSKPPQSPRAC